MCLPCLHLHPLGQEERAVGGEECDSYYSLLDHIWILEDSFHQHPGKPGQKRVGRHHLAYLCKGVVVVKGIQHHQGLDGAPYAVLLW